MTGEAGVRSRARAGGKPAVERRRWLWVALAATAAAVVVPGLATVHLPVSGDEMGLLLYPLKLSDGLVIHRDFFSPYGPGGYRLLQLAYAITEPSIVVERMVGITYHLAVALGIVVLLRPLGIRAAAVGGLACAGLLLFFAPLAYAWFGGLALATWSLAVLANTRSRGAAAFAGLLGALVAFWRPEMGILILPVAFLAWRTRRLLYFAVGAAVGALPSIAHLFASDFKIIDAVITSRLAVNAQALLAEVDPHVWGLLLMSVLCVGVVVHAALTQTRLRSLLIAIALLGVGLLPQTLQRTDIQHVIYAACFIVPCGVGVGASSSRFDPVFALLTPRRLAVGGVACTVAISCLSLIVARLPTIDVTVSGRTLPVTSENAARLTRVADALHGHVPAGSRVFMGPQDLSLAGLTDMELYYLTPEYRSPFYYLEVAPGASERAGSPLMQDLMRADALVLRYTPAWVIKAGFPNIEQGSDATNRVVEENFCLVATVDISKVYLRGPCQ